MSIILRKILPIMVAMMYAACVSNAQVVKFTYDDAGNRIKREVVTINLLENSLDESAEFKQFLKGERLNKNVNVKVDESADIIRVVVSDTEEFSEYEVSLYSVSGMKVICNISMSDFANIEIGGLPKGVYVLVVKEGNKADAWKVLKE